MKKQKLIFISIVFLIGTLINTQNVLAASSANADNQNKQNQTIQKQGWQVIGKNKYYYQNNHTVTGYRKIGKAWFLFNRQGKMQTGLQKVNHHYAYFDQLGRRHFHNANSKRAYYWIKNGVIMGIQNHAKTLCQRPEMPTGCEITAVTMMINFAGKKVSKFQAAKIMHRSGNPEKGFIGSPYKKYPWGYWVAPRGIQSVVKHYLGKSQIMTGAKMSNIKNKLLHSHLVVMWVGKVDGFSNHALALTGYHSNWLYYNDPWTGHKNRMTQTKFMYHWRLDAKRALSY